MNLEKITLESGAHESREDGMCLLEAAAWWAGERHSDYPACVSPVLAAYGRMLNDCLPADRRQQLRPFIPLLPGTAGDGRDQARGLMAADWLVRVYVPAWLDAAGLDAAGLRGLPPVGSWDELAGIQPLLDDARRRSSAAWAAWDAARDAARDAVWAAVWAAARAAARDAARDAAWAASRAKLSPVVSQLQDSAIALFDSMITAAPQTQITRGT